MSPPTAHRAGGSVFGVAARLFAIFVLASTVGCAVHVDMPEVPASHPASPDAQAAPLPPPSPLLDSYRPLEAPPEMPAMDHQGHEMEGHDHSMHESMEESEDDPAPPDHQGHQMHQGHEGTEPHTAETPEEPESHEHHQHPPGGGLD